VADAADKPTAPEGPGTPQKPDPPGYFKGESMTRRKAFIALGQAFGGLAVIGVTLPVVGFAVAPMFERPDETWQSVGSPDDFAPDNYRQTVITEVSGMGEAGKTTVYVRRGSPDLDEDPDEYIAISTRCAHLGCPVRFYPSAGSFICPCHGGIYDFEGRVTGGPPVRPLDRFQTRVRAGRVEIGPRFSVTNQLKPVRTRDPAAFTGGVWEYLYPPRPTTPPPPGG
jgi:menaquinol-cytochrome c reductase iron-sulfur subunit